LPALLAIVLKLTSAPAAIYGPRSSGLFAFRAPETLTFAGLTVILLPMAAALFFYYRPRLVYKKSLRSRFTAFLNRPAASVHLLFGLVVVVMAGSIFIRPSWGGIVSMICGVSFLVIMLNYKESLKIHGIMAALCVVALILAAGWFGWGGIPPFEWIIGAQGRVHSFRPDLWRDSLRVIRDFPITGTGLGTYADIIPKYKQFLLNSPLEHAHNDYIEFFIEGGGIGFLLAFCFLFSVFRQSFKVLALRRERYSRYLFWAGLSGLGAILVYSGIDRGFSIPVNGFYFFFISGLTVSAAHTRLRRSQKTILTEKKISSAGLFIISAGLLILLAAGLVFNISSMAGKYQFAPVKKKYPYSNMSLAELSALRGKTAAACRLDPLDAEYQSGLASLDMLLHNKRQALSHALKALRLKPVDAAFLQQCGTLVTEITGSSTAKLLLQAGINNDSFNPRRYYNYALWLFARGRMGQGREQLRLAMTVGPDISNTCIARMLLVGLNVKDIAATIPQQTRPALYFARYLDENGRYRLAGEFYRRAVEYTAAEKIVRPDYFYQPCNFFRRRQQYDDALWVMRQAAARLPDNVTIIMTIASLYDRMGISYRALEEYQKALILDPSNRKVQKIIKRLKRKN
ncbi:MAG TPA: hypothetical protein ENK33_00475, partial [Desulfobacterales bacterium]|nr:hypothetical protein [Desulfobacterales bacterium]